MTLHLLANDKEDIEGWTARSEAISSGLFVYTMISRHRAWEGRWRRVINNPETCMMLLQPDVVVCRRAWRREGVRGQ